MKQKVTRKKEKLAPIRHFDGLWKCLIEDLIADFLKFFDEKHGADIDLKSCVFLDKELDVLYPEQIAAEDRRYVDKLVRVKMKTGGEQFLLIHIEVQGQADTDFPMRMFKYYYRLVDRYKLPVAAMAIITGDAETVPDRYVKILRWGKVEYEYKVYPVKEQTVEILKQQKNPFALIVIGAKNALLGGQVADRVLLENFEWIAKAMESRKISKRKKIAMFEFLKRCVHFEDPANYRIFEQRMNEITVKSHVMGVQEYLIEEGVQKGRQEEREKILRQIIMDMLKSEYPVSEIARITKANEAHVRELQASMQRTA